ncbi:DMT family transporter [Paenibacillus thermotolerans]|uniref:DMT family transporter n=1 Tax=Paenibacillus thermotolerans TaxID=3027807 RepID=UPI00236870A5|nr:MULTISPECIES: EamA family transporter [unclassified Paenibacillus]
MKIDHIGVGAAVISAVCFGALGLFANIAYAAGWEVGGLLSMRFILASLLFWGVMPFIRGKQQIRVSARMLLILAGMGVFGYAVMALLLFTAYQYVPLGVAVTVFYTYPLLVSLFSSLLSRKPLGKRKASGLCLSLIGLVLMFGEQWALGASLYGIFLVLVCALVYTVFILVSEKVMASTDSYVGSAYISLSAAVTMSVYAAAVGQWDAVFAGGSAAPWLAAGALAVVSTFAAMTLFFVGVRRIGPALASSVSLIEPVAAAVMAVLFLGQDMTLIQLGGCGIVLAGVLIAHLTPKPKLSQPGIVAH